MHKHGVMKEIKKGRMKETKRERMDGWLNE
jgi:hypothetical protein